MAKRKIKHQLGDILQEIYQELAFSPDLVITCCSRSTGEPLSPSHVIFIFDQLVQLYDALGVVDKYTSAGSLGERLEKAISRDITATIVHHGREVSSRLPLQSLVGNRHNANDLSDVRDQVIAALGLPTTFSITVTPYSTGIGQGFATVALRCYLRRLNSGTTVESLRKGLSRRLCISGELRLLNAGKELRGRVGDIVM
jgi:hypothetical protein